MIDVRLYKSADGVLRGFDVSNHGPEIVCAAVSVLVINAINSIEAFTRDKAVVKLNEKGGYITFRLENGGEQSRLLLDSMLLGLKGVASEYEGTIIIKEEI